MSGKLAAIVVPVTPFAQNCTLLWDDETKHAVAIDPGGEAGRIFAAAQHYKLDLREIWLTHGHLDHAGGAEQLKELAGGIPIVGPHRADEFLLSAIGQQAAAYGLTGLADATPDRYLDEPDTLAIGPHQFEVRHVPGHTPGHVVFINRAARLAILGDTLFAGSIGRTDFPYGDQALLLAGIKRKLLTLPDEMRFLCGHGEGSTIGKERAFNPFLK